MEQIINFLLHLSTTISLLWTIIGTPGALVFGVLAYRAKHKKQRKVYWTYAGLGILGLILFWGSLELWKFYLIYTNATTSYVY